ncbi:response regulator transcription factor [Robinsoniella peoriensis]
MEYRYIIVDDEVLIRKGLISKIDEITSLKALCVGEAANGMEGLRVIGETNPDIIITDMKMKKMDGVEFLERISEQFPDKPIIVISGYKAFDYMNKAIEKRVIGYVLKPFSSEEIERQLHKAIEQIEKQKNFFILQEKAKSLDQRKIQDILLSAILEPWNEALEEELRQKGWGLDHYYLLMSVYTTDRKNAEHTEQLCRTSLSDIRYEFLPNGFGSSNGFLLLSCREEKLVAKMEVKAGHIAGHMMKGALEKIFICIGKGKQGFGELHKSYVKNEKLVCNIRMEDQKRLFYEKDEEWDEIYTREYVKDVFLNMKYHPKQAREIMEAYFDRMDLKRYSLRAIGNACESIVSMVNQYAVGMGVDTDDIMSVFYKRYLYCNDLDKMKKEISGYIALILSSIQMKSPDQNQLFHSIQEYIRKNYHQKLTLQMISSEFYVTPAYCSSLLKEKLDQSFNEYLGEIRLEKAKQLLRETDLSADRISDEIGYSNPKYFFKVFKKLTGFTPLEYRIKEKKKDAL